MPIKHPRRGSRWTDKVWSSEKYRLEVKKNLGVFSIQIKCKAIKLEEITKGIKVDEKSKGPKTEPRTLWY